MKRVDSAVKMEIALDPLPWVPVGQSLCSALCAAPRWFGSVCAAARHNQHTRLLRLLLAARQQTANLAAPPGTAAVS